LEELIGKYYFDNKALYEQKLMVEFSRYQVLRGYIIFMKAYQIKLNINSPVKTNNPDRKQAFLGDTINQTSLQPNSLHFEETYEPDFPPNSDELRRCKAYLESLDDTNYAWQIEKAEERSKR
ncbi:MAG: hypothetical protein PHE54_03030, partial [Bacilli bacterium]|nr:hypothetical protein [Bacilli bacterium]